MTPETDNSIVTSCISPNLTFLITNPSHCICMRRPLLKKLHHRFYRMAFTETDSWQKPSHWKSCPCTRKPWFYGTYQARCRYQRLSLVAWYCSYGWWIWGVTGNDPPRLRQTSLISVSLMIWPTLACAWNFSLLSYLRCLISPSFCMSNVTIQIDQLISWNRPRLTEFCPIIW